MQTIEKWIVSFPKGHKCLVIGGPTGVGKTFSMKSACRKLGLQTCVLDSETSESFRRSTVALYLDQRLMIGKTSRKIAIIDDIDIVPSSVKGDLLAFVRTTKFPVVCTSTCWDQTSKLAKMSEFVLLKRIEPALIERVLDEKFGADDQHKALSEMSHGDVRFAMNNRGMPRHFKKDADILEFSDAFSKLWRNVKIPANDWELLMKTNPKRFFRTYSSKFIQKYAGRRSVCSINEMEQISVLVDATATADIFLVSAPDALLEGASVAATVRMHQCLNQISKKRKRSDLCV